MSEFSGTTKGTTNVNYNGDYNVGLQGDTGKVVGKVAFGVATPSRFLSGLLVV